MSNKEFHNLAEAQLNLNSPTPSYWGNLGLWRKNTPAAEQDYAQACSALAHLVAQQAQLQPDDVLVDIGFGCGDQLLLWLQHYRVEQLYGLNISRSQTQLSQQRLIGAGYAQPAPQISIGSHADMLPWAAHSLSASPTKIIALDCAYHCSSRQQFLADSYTQLAPQGQLVLCDLILDDKALGPKQKLILKTLCRLCNIPYGNLLVRADYLHGCKQLGFELQNCEDITEQVFLPFGQWLLAYRQQHASKGLRWGKYRGTAWFLRWAVQQQALRYVVISLSKAQGDK